MCNLSITPILPGLLCHKYLHTYGNLCTFYPFWFKRFFVARRYIGRGSIWNFMCVPFFFSSSASSVGVFVSFFPYFWSRNKSASKVQMKRYEIWCVWISIMWFMSTWRIIESFIQIIWSPILWRKRRIYRRAPQLNSPCNIEWALIAHTLGYYNACQFYFVTAAIFHRILGFSVCSKTTLDIRVSFHFLE